VNELSKLAVMSWLQVCGDKGWSIGDSLYVMGVSDMGVC